MWYPKAEKQRESSPWINERVIPGHLQMAEIIFLASNSIISAGVTMTSTIAVLQGCNNSYGNRSQQFCVLLVSFQIYYIQTRMEIYLIGSASSQSELHVRDSCLVEQKNSIFLLHTFSALSLFHQDAQVNRSVSFKMDLVSQNFEEHCLLHVTF